MKLRFDHVFNVDKNFTFRKKLGDAGFNLVEREVEHPGKHFCRFIMFPEPDGKRQYLEFIHVGAGGEPLDMSGISLAAGSALEPFSKTLNSKVKTDFGHKNYEWKKNNTDRLPGWNFVMFPKHKSKVFTWLTEYEFSKKRKMPKKKDSTHPNGTHKIFEFNMQLSLGDVKLYTHLLGKPVKNEFRLDNGTTVKFKIAKNSRIDSVVILTKNLKHMVQNFKWDQLISYNGQAGVMIKHPNSKMWDVIVIQG